MKYIFITLCLIVSSIKLISQEKDCDNFSTFSNLSYTEKIKFKGDFISQVDLDSNNIFLAGELHYRQFNLPIQLGLMEFLYSKGIRVFVFEEKASLEHRIRSYLETGNIAFLDNITKSGKYYYSQLLRFYKSLPEDDKFIIKTIDVGCLYADYFNILYDLLPKNAEPPHEIDSAITTIIESKNIVQGKKILPYEINLNEIKQFINEDIESKQEVYKSYLKENYDFFFRTVKSDSCGCLPHSRNKPMKHFERFQKRERFMAQEIETIIDDYPGVKIFGQFGRTHIRKTKYTEPGYFQGLTSFTALLEEKDSSKFNICSFYFYYSKSFNKKYDEVLAEKKYLKKLDKQFKKTIGVFKLSECEWFKKSKDKYDYVVVIPER